jgi:predicted RNA methylase
MEDLFPHKDGVDYTTLKTTQEGEYSITRRRDAIQILNIFRMILKDMSSKTITDTTGCIGGDTINFALHFQTVHSIELKRSNYEILKHNVDCYNLLNVKLYNGDSTTIYNWYSDVVYIDPPWGGPQYRDSKLIDIILSNKRLDKWVEEILLRKNRPSYIFLKLPYNYNFNRFNFLSNTEMVKAYKIRSYVLIAITVHKPEKRIISKEEKS